MVFESHFFAYNIAYVKPCFYKSVMPRWTAGVSFDPFTIKSKTNLKNSYIQVYDIPTNLTYVFYF